MLADDGFDDAARSYAAKLAAGPTLAHAATKQVLRDYLEGGVELANDRVGAVAGAPVRDRGPAGRRCGRSSTDGPGRATFHGR